MRTTTRTCDWCGGVPTGPPGWITVEDAGLPPTQGRCIGRVDLCSWGHVAEFGAAMARLMAVEDEFAPRLASLSYGLEWGRGEFAGLFDAFHAKHRAEYDETWGAYQAALYADEDVARAHRLMARHGHHAPALAPAEASR